MQKIVLHMWTISKKHLKAIEKPFKFVSINRMYNIMRLKQILINSMSNNQTLKISICTINNVVREISVPTTYTGYQLKEYIYTNVTQSLKIHEMKLCSAGMKIEDDKLLSAYKIGSTIKMIQAKCDIDEVPGLIVSYEQDPISLEEITARMPCGHVIGRDCMTQFIRSLVQAHIFTITCPSYKPNDQRCACEWDYALCKKVGVFTKQETIQFQRVKQNNNWKCGSHWDCCGPIAKTQVLPKNRPY